MTNCQLPAAKSCYSPSPSVNVTADKWGHTSDVLYISASCPLTFLTTSFSLNQTFSTSDSHLGARQHTRRTAILCLRVAAAHQHFPLPRQWQSKLSHTTMQATSHSGPIEHILTSSHLNRRSIAVLRVWARRFTHSKTSVVTMPRQGASDVPPRGQLNNNTKKSSNGKTSRPTIETRSSE